MKVAVTMFKEGMSPRLDIADSLWIYQIDKEKKTATLNEKCNAAYEQPAQLIGILKEKGITAVICGGCPQYFLRMLVFHGVEVVPGVMGDPGPALNQLARGKSAHNSPGLLAPVRGRPCRRRSRGSPAAPPGRRRF